MKKLLLFLVVAFFTVEVIYSQVQQTTIKQMTWGTDYQVYLKMDNDSDYRFAIDELFHANPEIAFNRKTEFVYFPVSFEQSYIDSLVDAVKPVEEFTLAKPRDPQIRRITLWNSVGQSIGGGWAHFINCLVFVLETRQLEITAPLLTRPESTWKPKPMTDSYKRTRNWMYFVPVTQKQARKEYKIRKKRNQLGDLQNIPQAYVQLMLNTSEKEYVQMIEKKDFKSLAQIDLVKLLLGTPYLGEAQINYIKSRVLQSIANYNSNHMPSVMIFDKYEAAVAMSLDGMGYKAEKIVFKDEDKLSAEEIRQRRLIINGIIALINESNTKAFRTRLDGMYKDIEQKQP